MILFSSVVTIIFFFFSDNKICLLSDDEMNTKRNVVSDDILVFTKIISHPICDHQIVSIGAGPVHTAFVTGMFICKLKNMEEVS